MQHRKTSISYKTIGQPLAAMDTRWKNVLAYLALAPAQRRPMTSLHHARMRITNETLLEQK
eukprot:768817-Hanusia_phi.AAC.1